MQTLAESPARPTGLAPAIRQRIPIHVGNPRRVSLVLAGCGGTGSFLALHLARLAYHAREQHGIGLEMSFVDPDVVEARNIGRQNFVPAEIGDHKARALASRYSRAFGLSIHFASRQLDKGDINRAMTYRDNMFHLIVGCVDNPDARREIRSIVELSQSRLWWLDCGNHETSGQVLLGNLPKIRGPEISPLGFCIGLPLPSTQHPELMNVEPRPAMSCADAALADVQSLMVNQQVAGWAASYLYRLIITRDLDSYATYFDMAAGSARSEYIHQKGRE